MFGSPHVSRPLLDRSAASLDRGPAVAPPGRAFRRFDALAIAAVWTASLSLSLLLEPRHDEITTWERLYYSVYEIAMGSLVGFYLFDRLPRDGWSLFVVRAACAILFGTLVNEVFVEPLVFAGEPINREGLYYGLTDALSVSGLFLLIRLAERLHRLQQSAPSVPETASAPGGNPRRATSAASACFFVRVAGGTRRIHAPDVLYMEAERDCTRIVGWWRGTILRSASRLQDSDWRWVEQGRANRRALLRAFHRAGVPLLVGTDTPNPFVFVGASIHDELANHVAAGLTPAQALAAATREPARFLGQESAWGTIELGRRADLLLLEANPLEDIGATRRIAGVMAGGRWLPAERLSQMRLEVEQVAAASN